jgi:hypothetical protein
MLDLAIAGECLLEFFDFFSKNERRILAHAIQRLENFAAQEPVLRL